MPGRDFTVSLFVALAAVLVLCCSGCGSSEKNENSGEKCTPKPEICDGRDNDCDGTIDNEPQASQSCDDGDYCTTNVCRAGECFSYPSGQCGEECTPKAEICDGKDNDCDGTIDNEPQASQSCDDGDHCTTNVCRAGECISYQNGQCDLWDWTTDIDAPEGRYRHSAIWTGERMIVWGGTGGVDIDIYRDGFSYDPVGDTWQVIREDRSVGPSWRLAHTAVWTGTEMIIWGGVNAPAPYYNDGARYLPAEDRWLAMSATTLNPRANHTAVWSGSEMLVWGGEQSVQPLVRLNDGAGYSPATDSWSAMSLSGAPSERAKHSAVWSGSEMLVWGGLGNNNQVLGDGGRYNPAEDSWASISTEGAPAARWGHIAVWTGERMLVWGGSGDSDAHNSGGLYDPLSDSWTPITNADAPSARTNFAGVWSGSSLIVWGGTTSTDDNEATGGVYNPERDRWHPTSMRGVPRGCSYPSAVWTGSQMIVWGGWRWNLDDTFEFVNSGGKYLP